MSDQLDLLARQAAEDLGTSTSADPGQGLTRLYAGNARRRSRNRLVVAALLLGALSAGWFGRGVMTSATELEPSGPPSPSQSPPPHETFPTLCERELVSCLGHRTYTFGLVTPVRWHIPEGFGVDSGSGASDTLVESYSNHGKNPSGVTVVETVRPPNPVGRPAPGFEGGASPRDYARWLATRPFLEASTPRQATVGGRPGWQVRVSLAAGAREGGYVCTAQFRCHPITLDDTGDVTGIWDDMVADYTFVSLPTGTAVVWSWAFGHDTQALDRNGELAAGISWPGH
jgi:hypothetical protein